MCVGVVVRTYPHLNLVTHKCRHKGLDLSRTVITGSYPGDSSHNAAGKAFCQSFHIGYMYMSPLLLQTSGNRDALVAHIRKDVDCIHNLVLYYQMETRSSLRAVMLQIFAALCTMSAAFITTLLYSVLTLELVRDLMSTEGLFVLGSLKAALSISIIKRFVKIYE